MIDKQKIQAEAREILKRFSKKLEKITEDSEPIVERKECERQEGENISAPIDRKTMFENASNKSDDFIIAERGEW